MEERKDFDDSSENVNNKRAFPKTKEQWLQEGINHYHAEDYTMYWIHYHPQQFGREICNSAMDDNARLA
jgi:hypothetical protein